YLVAALSLQCLWSLSLAIVDIYALLVKRSLRNSIILGLFTIGDAITSTLTFAAACASAGAPRRCKGLAKARGVTSTPRNRPRLGLKAWREMRSEKTMIHGTDLHQFNVYNDGYFAHLPLTYVDGVILKIVVPRMPYEQLAKFLEQKCGCYFQGQAITYDMDDLVSKKISPPKKRYCNGFSVDEHTSVRNFNFGALVNYKWIAKIFSDKIRANPDIRSYGKAVLDFNPGSTVKLRVTVNPDGKTYFDRFYVCFARLEDGWKASCWKGNELTLMSDQHKGLIEAVKDVMPNAEHRQCSRHIYENFRKQYHGLEYRQLFWEASKASHPQLFNKIIDKIKSANSNAHKYLMDKNSKTWSRAFFEIERGCEAIKNGFRNEPLGFWHVIPASENLFEVRSGNGGFTVDDDMYIAAYHNYVKLVPGMNFWPDQSMYSTVLPPKPRRMPGRPRKKKIRAIVEGGSSTRISKVGKPRKKKPVDDFEDVDVVQRDLVRDEGASGTRGCVIGSGCRADVVESRGGANGSIGRRAGGSSGSSGSRGRGAGGYEGASGSRGRGIGGSKGRGAGGSKKKLVSTAGTQKRQGKKRLRLLALLNGLDCKMNQSRLKLNHNRLNMNLRRHKLKTKWSRLKIKLRET
nr:hypothetical protein [Tanacetum cinerariifolium]